MWKIGCLLSLLVLGFVMPSRAGGPPLGLKEVSIFPVACPKAAHERLLFAAAGGQCAAEYGEGWYDCITNFCNTEGLFCCPPGHPYLNHCDCQCYESSDFDCKSYSNCRY